MGITAKLPGKCVLCGGAITPGMQIDRVPGYDTGRGHVECINKPPQVQPRQAQPAPYQPPVQAAPAPAPVIPINNGSEYHGAEITHLVAIRCNLEQMIASLDHLIAIREARR